MFDVSGLSILTAMITPAVLISASGTLILSTSTRLARVVDRVRHLSQQVQALASGEIADFVDERWHDVEEQLAFYAQRSRLVQSSLTSFYVALGLFVATTITIALGSFVPEVAWLPSVLGIAGTVIVFFGCMLLITEARLAIQAVKAEMAFALRLKELYQARRVALESPTTRP